ncbi:MAG: DUF1549 domain-containing protein [Myxococcaceae bacterium]
MRSRAFTALLCALVALVVALAAKGEERSLPPPAPVPDEVGRLDEMLASKWKASSVEPAPRAEPLTVLRRLSLALFGQSPSLEEIRRFEADGSPDRLARWTHAMLEDARFHRYWAERLSRAWVGAERGPFIVFRRDRFDEWLAGELAKNTPYDAVVRQVVSAEGTWTGEPAANFVTSAVANREVDSDKLTGRTMRVFLGQRLECAQCHDHPFAPWTQQQFDGVKAFFDRTDVSALGVTTRAPGEAKRERGAMNTRASSSGAPSVPYGLEWLPAGGSPRLRLAAWLTDAHNVNLSRAMVNRAWALMYGRPLHEPVDDLPALGEEPVLDALAEDFASHGHDLRRLVTTLALAQAFSLESRELGADEKNVWAAYPVTPLRPEQVVGALLQAGSVRSIDRDRHLVVRAVRLLREKAFIDEYGDPGEAELTPQADTVARALFRMNGKLPDDVLKAEPFSTTGRVAMVAKGDDEALDALWLSYLTRRPTEEEAQKVRPMLAGLKGDERGKALADVAWGLFNSSEFSWSH